MTVKELIELNQMIVDAEITIREDGTRLVDQLNIGMCEGVVPPHPQRVPKHTNLSLPYALHDDKYYKNAAYIYKSINAWDDGKDYYQIKMNRFPQAWLDLEVFAWEVWPASAVGVPRRCIEGKFRNVNFHGQRINIIALPSGQSMKVNEEPKEKPEEYDGQMSITDWMEGEE